MSRSPTVFVRMHLSSECARVPALHGIGEARVTRAIDCLVNVDSPFGTNAQRRIAEAALDEVVMGIRPFMRGRRISHHRFTLAVAPPAPCRTMPFPAAQCDAAPRHFARLRRASSLGAGLESLSARQRFPGSRHSPDQPRMLNLAIAATLPQSRRP